MRWLFLLLLSSVIFNSCQIENIEIDPNFGLDFQKLICPKKGSIRSSAQCPATPTEEIHLIPALGLHHLKRDGHFQRFLPSLLLYSEHAGIPKVPIEILSDYWKIQGKKQEPNEKGAFALFIKPNLNEEVDSDDNPTQIRLPIRQKGHWCYCAVSEMTSSPPLVALDIPKTCPQKKITVKFLLRKDYALSSIEQLKKDLHLVFIADIPKVAYKISIFKNDERRWQIEFNFSCPPRGPFHIFVVMKGYSALHIPISLK